MYSCVNTFPSFLVLCKTILKLLSETSCYLRMLISDPANSSLPSHPCPLMSAFIAKTACKALLLYFTHIFLYSTRSGLLIPTPEKSVEIYSCMCLVIYGIYTGGDMAPVITVINEITNLLSCTEECETAADLPNKQLFMGSYSSLPCLHPRSLLPSRMYILFKNAMYICFGFASKEVQDKWS